METEWRFSIAQLLVITTLVALLATAMRHSTLFNEERSAEAFLLGASVTIAVASVIIWSLDIPSWLRLAGVLGVSIGMGALLQTVDQSMTLFAMPDFVVQGVVLSAWLAWGHVLPAKESADVDPC